MTDHELSEYLSKYVSLCLVRTEDGGMEPVYTPSYNVSNGDIAFFTRGKQTEGVIVFNARCREDEELWTAVTIASGKHPCRMTAIKHICEWGEYDERLAREEHGGA